jgi:hypothetical protein
MQVIFTFETKYGPFSDSLHLDEDHTFTDNDIEAMKQQRLTNWLAVIEAPPTEETEATRAITDAIAAAIKAAEESVIGEEV